MLNAFLILYDLHHLRNVSGGRKHIYTDRSRSHSIDGNALVDRQDIRIMLRDDFQHIGKQTRLIPHLQNEGDGLPLHIFMKRKDIVLILVKGASADSQLIHRLLYRFHSIRFQKFLCLHHF